MSDFKWYYRDGFRRHTDCTAAEDGLVVDATDGPVPDWQCIACGAVSSEAARGVYRECNDPQCESRGLVHAHRTEDQSVGDH